MPSYIQSTDPEVLPNGSEWEFKVEDAQEKESQAGNPLIELKLRILNGADEGQAVYDLLTFTPKAFFRIDQFRLATGDKLEPGKEVVLNAEDCIGRRGRVVLKIDNYQGRPRNKVDFYVIDQVRSNKTAGSSAGSAVARNELGEPVDTPF